MNLLNLPRLLIGVVLSTCICAYSDFDSTTSCPTINVVVLGLGGRSHSLLLNCLQLKHDVNKKIRVLAVSDDRAQSSLDFYLEQLKKKHPDLVNDYREIFSDTVFYTGSNESIEQLFSDYKSVDKVFITSANYDHLRHLQSVLKYSDCPSIYMEKPLFRDLEELESLSDISESKTIDIGLTLRYSNVARIVSEKLKEFKDRLGSVTKVSSWEHVGFGHGFTAFMMGWRRYISLSGGFLLEKSIHDIDLAFFLMYSLGLSPNKLSIDTKAQHSVFKKSNKEEILNKILTDQRLRKTIEWWNDKSWQRLIDFEYSLDGKILWEPTLDTFFKDFPEDDCLDQSDIIFDNYRATALFEAPEGNEVQFELEVKVDGFSTATKRGIHFDCEFGSVHVDIMEGEMTIQLSKGEAYQFDLCSDHTSHAGGDAFIAQTLFDSLTPGQHKATYNDPIVQMSMMIGLSAEYQAKNQIAHPIVLEKINEKWVRK